MNRRQHVITFENAEDLCEQTHKEDCDVNTIMRKFQKTGIIEHRAKHGLQYGNVPAMDYREAMETVAISNSMFEELPSKARQYFDNDPAKFLEFTENPENIEKLATLDIGLGKPVLRPVKKTQEATEEPPKDQQTAKKGSKATSTSEAESKAPASGEEA